MEYHMGLKSEFTQEECAKYIYHVFSDVIEIEATYDKYEVCSKCKAHIAIGCEYMTCWAFMEEPEEIDYSYYKEEHGICITNIIGLQLCSQTWKKGMEILFLFLNYMIQDYNADFVLDDDTSCKAVLGKKESYFYTQLVKDGEIEFPFHLIERKVVRELEV